MVCKRKRSAIDDSPLSISSFGSCATPEAQSPTPLPFGFSGTMDVDVDNKRSPPQFGSARDWFAYAQRVKATDLGCRTRKRYRDNRPDEQDIHETTIEKLFSAQRNLPHASPIPSSQSQPVPESQPAPVQKSTLHSFWKIAAPPVQPVRLPAIQVQQPRDLQQPWDMPRCEDCDAALQQSDAMDIDMDMDGGVSGSQFGCFECGRKICGGCAVVSINRHCLHCATSGREGQRW